MRDNFEQFLNIKYEGARFSGGRLPLDVLADLQALEDILTTFAREIWLKENNRERMPSGYADWFGLSLKGVGDGSAVPKLELSVLEDSQTSLMGDTRRGLMRRAEQEFERVLKAANEEHQVALSPTQIRNFNRFLTSLKDGELFKYSSEKKPITNASSNVISLDLERRKRFLTSVKTTYEQRVQGRARLKSVDENGNLRFIGSELRDFTLLDDSRSPTEYGANLSSYYEFDLTVVRRFDDIVQDVVTIHDLSILEHPVVDAVNQMHSLKDGWLDGYGKAIQEVIREKAKNFIHKTMPLPEFYAVAPTEEGGILLEYENNGWDYGVEFNADGSYTFFGIELKSHNEFSDTIPQAGFQLLQERVKDSIVIND